jgi:hypothetical protein
MTFIPLLVRGGWYQHTQQHPLTPTEHLVSDYHRTLSRRTISVVRHGPAFAIGPTGCITIALLRFSTAVLPSML